MNKSGLFKCFFSVFIVSFCTRRKSRFFFSALHSGVFRYAEKNKFFIWRVYDVPLLIENCDKTEHPTFLCFRRSHCTLSCD